MNVQAKLFLEAYFELALCCMVGSHAFYKYGLKLFLETTDDIFCTVLTILYAILGVAFPLMAIKHIREE